MFDLMKDMYLEASGLDMDKVREERREKIEKEKSETIIFHKNTKKTIGGFGLILIMISAVMTYVAINQGSTIDVVKNVLMLLVEAITLICLMIKQKETEIISIIGMAIIGVMFFVVPMIL